MKYRLKIESSLREVEDYILPEEYTIAEAVTAAERSRSRVWLVNSYEDIVATWDGWTWT